MILKLQTGGARELLSLTPVIREYVDRQPQEPVVVESSIPGILSGNPSVWLSCQFIEADVYSVVDLDMLEVSQSKSSLVDAYAKAVLGDTKLRTRQFELYESADDRAVAKAHAAGAPLAVCGFDNRISRVPQATLDEVIAGFQKRGYNVLVLLDTPGPRWGYWKAVIDEAMVYVGLDCDLSYVAMATRTPMVMHVSYRPLSSVVPYRRGAPFVGLGPQPNQCETAPYCLEVNGRGEFGVLYDVKCSAAIPFLCGQSHDAAAFLSAAEEVERMV